METKLSIQNCDGKSNNSNFINYSSMVHSKKVVKHALRQQVKRRRKNTTIAAGNHRPIAKVIHSLPTITADLPLSILNDQQNHIVVEETAVTMKEVLASLPGFSMKSNKRRSTKKLSVAAQLEAGLVDLESPTSILTNTSLRSLLNRHTFQGLPPLYQRKLAQLLPAVDRQDAAVSGLNNEFFARACQEWRKRLAEGEFTSENQQKLKMEAEKDKNKLDPWKLKHFEPIWGEKREIHKLKIGLHCMNKEQRFTNASLQTNLGSQIETNLKSVLRDHPSSELSSLEKDEQNISLFSSKKLHENHSDLVKERRIMPKFNVTVQILEDEDEDDENEEGEDDEDEEDDEEDDEDDEDEEDDEEDEDDEDDDEEDEDEDDEIDAQISLAYLEEESQHCRAIIVTNTNSEDLFKKGKVTTEMPVIEQRKYSKEMILDFINDKKFLEVDLKVKEQKCDLRGRNIERALKSSIKEFKYVASDTYRNILDKSGNHFPNKNEEQLCTISKDDLENEPNPEIYQSTVSKLKFIVKDDPSINIKTTENEKASCSSDLCCSENNRISDCDPNSMPAEVTEVIEIDNETLQRIHELEVQGEMQEAYQEMSNCHEEIVYPILDDIEINSNDAKNTSTITDIVKNREMNSNVINKTEEEAFLEANNYVCSEMLDCTWTSNTNENSSINYKEKHLVSWPQVVNVTDDKILSTNVTITNISDSNDSENFLNQNISRRDQLPTNMEDSNSFSCIQLPVTAFNSDTLRISPVTSCLMKNVHTTQSSSVITFPQLQSIRFVQTNFQTTIERSSTENIPNAASLCAQIQSSTSITEQSHENLNNSEQDICKNQKNIETEIQADSEFTNRPSNILSGNSMHQNLQTQNTVVLQQQTLLPMPTRPIVAMQSQQQSHYPMTMNVPCKINRNSGLQNTHRSSRNNNKDQNNSRSRNTTKEPPGAVNFERSYQICQAVIASSPNRDQLKAHLKPPPSLLTKVDNSHNNSKFNTRSFNSNNTQKNFQMNQGGLLSTSRSQGVTVKHIITTSRQNCQEETIDDCQNRQEECNNFSEISQYLYVKKTELDENIPRASSAPPIPPHMSLMKVGTQIVHGRPASADERSYQTLSLKCKKNNLTTIGAKLETSIIINGENISSCECNIQEAMIICRQCGAFCHHNCISPQYICAICLIG